ncbi:hypothetical protein PR048_008864 [Dryococelus australis]|uniref:Uncharacterized protein n=1 Tax=Dryococelus australis TaxID=614101 RepID=A0ABQ9HYA9_9NEOP|nr:hypothetical protein PR048_008864 [Dryococelus australis]
MQCLMQHIHPFLNPMMSQERNEIPLKLGIRITNNSLKNLLHYLKGKYGITYIPTDKSNIDALQNLYSI